MKSPAVILFDAAGTAMAVQNGVILSPVAPALLLAGSDGANSRFLKTATDGKLHVDLQGWYGSAVPTVGQKVMAQSIPVTFASNQTALPVTLAAPANATTGIDAAVLQLGGATSGTVNAVRATPYNEQTVGAQRSISSSSASDTAAPGVGARTVRIEYLTSAGVALTETVTLNGVTPVNTVATDICYIEHIFVVTAGSTGRNVGTITLFVATGGGGGVIGTIGVGSLVTGQGDSRTLWAHHYIPAGVTAQFYTLVVSAESGGSGTNATYFMRAVVLPQGANAEKLVSDVLLVIGPLVRQLAIPITVVGFARTVVYGVPGSNNVKLAASYDFSESPT